MSKRRTQAGGSKGIHPMITGLLCGLLIFPARNAYFILMSRYSSPYTQILTRSAEALGMILLLAAALLVAALFINSRFAQKITRYALGLVILLSSVVALYLFSWGSIFIHAEMTYCGSDPLGIARAHLYNAAADPATFVLWLSVAAVWHMTKRRTVREILLFGTGCAITVILLTAASTVISILTAWDISNEAREIVEPTLASAAYIGCLLCGVWILVTAPRNKTNAAVR